MILVSLDKTQFLNMLFDASDASAYRHDPSDNQDLLETSIPPTRVKVSFSPRHWVEVVPQKKKGRIAGDVYGLSRAPFWPDGKMKRSTWIFFWIQLWYILPMKSAVIHITDFSFEKSQKGTTKIPAVRINHPSWTPTFLPNRPFANEYTVNRNKKN